MGLIDSEDTSISIREFIPSQWVSDTAMIRQIENSVRHSGKERTFIQIPQPEMVGYVDYRDFKDSVVYLPKRLVTGREISLPKLIEQGTFSKGKLITGEDFHTLLKLLMPSKYEVLMGSDPPPNKMIMGNDTVYIGSGMDISTNRVYLVGRVNISEQINAIIVNVVYGNKGQSNTYLITLKDTRVLSKFSFLWNDKGESTCYVCPGNLFIIQNINKYSEFVDYNIYKILDDGHVRFLQSPDELKKLNGASE